MNIRGPNFWVDKLMTRERLARPLLNAAMFGVLMETVNLIAFLFPGFLNVVTRWLLTIMVFVGAFVLYVRWEDYGEKAKEKVEEASDG